MSKLGMLAAGAAGYVLGARAGRERYDQIVAVATRFWSSPQVQHAQLQAQDYAREKAPEVGEKIGEVAKAAAVKATEAVPFLGADNEESSASSSSSSGTAKKTAAKRTSKTAAKKQTAKKTTAKKTSQS
jgi:hypothetical protein